MTGALLLVARLVLATVFAVAAVGKLADREGARRAARDFGVPDRISGAVAVALPLAELAVAVLLLPRGTAWTAAVAALGLLTLFCTAIGLGLARGRAPDCHCFGQLHSEPAGWRTLARNAALIALAGVVVVAGSADAGPDAVAWTRELDGAAGAAAAATAVLALVVAGAALWALVGVLRAQERLRGRVRELQGSLAAVGLVLEPEAPPAPGLPVGEPAPAFAVPDLAGERVTLDDLRADGLPVLLVLTDPACGPCRELAPDLARWQREHADRLVVAVVSGGDADATAREAAQHGLARVLLDAGGTVYDAYDGAGTPGAVLVTPDGAIAAPLAAGRGAIEALVRDIVGEPAALEVRMVVGGRA